MSSEKIEPRLVVNEGLPRAAQEPSAVIEAMSTADEVASVLTDRFGERVAR